MTIIPLINEFTKNFNERLINTGFIKYFNFYSLFYPARVVIKLSFCMHFCYNIFMVMKNEKE